MPPPASNDTGTALGQDSSGWSRDLATLTFDLGGHGTCGWCGSSSSIHILSLKSVGLAIRKIRRTMCVSINGPGDLDLWPWNWCASRIDGGEPSFRIWARQAFGLSSYLLCTQRTARTDRRTKATLTAPFPKGGGIIIMTVLRERKPPPRPKSQPKLIQDSNPDFRIQIHMSARSFPKCYGFITLSASVISPSVVTVGRWLYEKC